MYKPYGVLSAMITPMNSDESINEVALRKQTDRFVESKIHGLFCLGTNGEFYALSHDEKIKVMQIVVEQTNKRKPVCAGVGCVTTAETVALAQKAQEIGADAISVITPYFGQVGQDELVAHYKSVAESVDIGVILYNIPARTGNSISRATVEKLAKVKNIVAIKDSSGSFDNILQYLEATGREFPVLSGNDSLILYTLMAGGVGGIAGTGNLFPNKMGSIYDLFLEKKYIEAQAIQDGIRHIRDCFSLGNPNSVVKRCAHLLGEEVGPIRRPFSGSFEKWDERLKTVLDMYYKDWN